MREATLTASFQPFDVGVGQVCLHLHKSGLQLSCQHHRIVSVSLLKDRLVHSADALESIKDWWHPAQLGNLRPVCSS